jgi:hypothetical protein
MMTNTSLYPRPSNNHRYKDKDSTPAARWAELPLGARPVVRIGDQEVVPVSPRAAAATVAGPLPWTTWLSPYRLSKCPPTQIKSTSRTLRTEVSRADSRRTLHA